MKNLTKGTPVFFKSSPKTPNTPPDAVYLGIRGTLPNGDTVYELSKGGQVWLVGEDDFHVTHEAMALAAEAYRAQIDAKRTPGMKLGDLAKALGITTGTLKKRLSLIQNFIPAAPIPGQQGAVDNS